MKEKKPIKRLLDELDGAIEIDICDGWMYYLTKRGWHKSQKDMLYMDGKVIYKLGIDEVPYEVLRDYREFKNQKDTDMKRFKTLRELDNLHPYPLSLPFGEPYNKSEFYSFNVMDYLLTDAHHPYEGKSFKIRVTPDESKKVQEKSFKLGYKWSNFTTDIQACHAYGLAFSVYKIISACPSYHVYHDAIVGHIELTPQQFLDGDLPEEVGEVKRLHDEYWAKERGVYGEAEKGDAYIDIHCKPANLIYEINGEIFTSVGIGYAYQYNLMSEEEFKKKHEPKKLRFKEWLVQVKWSDRHDQEVVDVGCEQFTIHELKAFFHVGLRLRKHSIHLHEAHDFLKENKKELELI